MTARVQVLPDLPEHARLLLAIRQSRGWTQAELAHRLNVGVSTLREWEHARAQPNVRDLSLLRALLSEGLSSTGWAHVAALDNLHRDVRAGRIGGEEAVALVESLHRVRAALLAVGTEEGRQTA